MKPITPQEVGVAKAASLPPKVIGAWNDLIVAKWNGSSARILQKEALAAIVKAMWPNADPDTDLPEWNTVRAKGWLDIEEMYRAQGWKVEYDRPGYCESYDAHFIFSKP